MKCDNGCPNVAEYTLHAPGKLPIHVCAAHIYVYKANTNEYVIQPLTLEGHIAAFKRAK